MLEFDKNGYLIPHQIIESDLIIFEQTFVFNEHRRQLFERFVAFSEEFKQIYGKNFFIWIDGSFVTKKYLPFDIDLVVFLDADFIERNFLKLNKIRNNFANLHIFYGGLYLPDNQLFVVNKLEKFRWFDLFSTDRGFQPKGFLQINF